MAEIMYDTVVGGVLKHQVSHGNLVALQKAVKHLGVTAAACRNEQHANCCYYKRAEIALITLLRVVMH